MSITKTFEGEAIIDEITSIDRLSTPSKTSAPTVAQAGSFYYNSTSDTIFRSDGSNWILVQDGTNSLGSNYARNITVAQSGADYNNIQDAITEAVSLTPAPGNFVRITIYPGVYDLPSNQSLPQYSSLFAVGDVFINKSGGGGLSDHYFSMTGFAQINGIQFISAGLTNSVCIRYEGQNNMIRNCSFSGSERYLFSNVANSQLFCETVRFTIGVNTISTITITGSNSFLRIEGLRVEGNNILSNIISVKSSGNETLIYNIFSNAIIDLFADIEGSDLTIDGGKITNATTAILAGNNCIGLISGISFENNTNDLALASGSDVTVSSSKITFTKINFAGGILRGEFQDPSPDEPAIKIVSELNVGDALNPVEAVFGGGDSNTNGMRVFHCQATGPLDNGSGFIEITNDVKFDDGVSADGFASTAVNECLLIGYERAPFAGIKIDLMASAIPDGLRNETILEYYGSGQFNETVMMSTESNPDYGSFANRRFQTGDYQYRFGYLPSDQSLTTINGVSAYWFRFRITSAITTVPAIDRIKIHPPNRLEINSDGFTEIFNSTTTQRQTLDINTSQVVFGSPANQDLFIGTNFGFGFRENSFQSFANDTVSFIISVPDNINTARPLTISFRFMGESSSSGNVRFNIKAAFMTDNADDPTTSGIFNTNGAAPATPPGQILDLNDTFSFGLNQDDILLSVSVPINIERLTARRPSGNSDLLGFNMTRFGSSIFDTYPGDTNIVAIEYRYNVWHY